MEVFSEVMVENWMAWTCHALVHAHTLVLLGAGCQMHRNGLEKVELTGRWVRLLYWRKSSLRLDRAPRSSGTLKRRLLDKLSDTCTHTLDTLTQYFETYSLPSPYQLLPNGGDSWRTVLQVPVTVKRHKFFICIDHNQIELKCFALIVTSLSFTRVHTAPIMDICSCFSR